MTPIILLPGLLCDDEVWRDSLVDLRLAGPDPCLVPNYGGLSSIEAMATHVWRWLNDQRLTQPVCLVGHSMGGRVALDMVRQAPDRLSRLVLLDSGFEALASGEPGQRERQQRLALWAQAQSQGMRAMGAQWAQGMVHPRHLGTALFERVLTMIERQTPATFEAQIEALLNRPGAQAVLQNLPCPSLIACGRDDAWSPLARHQTMHELAQHSAFESQLAIIDDCGHMSPMEQPRAVTRLILQALNH